MAKNTLQYLCIKQVCEDFSNEQQYQQKQLSLNFGSIPEDVKDKLLSHLLKTRTLNNNNIQSFLSPTRRYLSLDCEDDGGWINKECFSTIANICTGLNSLSLANCSQLTTKELTEIVGNCQELNAISLRGCGKLDDESLDIISKNCKKLIYLDLFGIQKITSTGIQTLSSPSSPLHSILEFISLGECTKIKNVALDALSNFKNLREINFIRCPLINNNGLVPLCNGPSGKSIQALDISHCGGILDQGLITIATHLPQLRTIQMKGLMRITHEGVAAIAKNCTLLESISISQCKQLTNEAVAAIITNCKNLLALEFSFLDLITDAAFEEVPALPSLVSILMTASKVTDVAVKKLALAAPNLQVWDLNRCGNISDDSIITIGQNCPQMTRIFLSDCFKITDAGVKELAMGCPLLTTVVLGGWATITDEGVKSLSTHCKAIRTIDLGGLVKITNQSLRFLGESCPNLYSVSVYDCKSLTADGIHTLVEKAPTLQRLDVGGKSGITPQQTQNIIEKYKNRYLAVVS